jgi:hypothetical protein
MSMDRTEKSFEFASDASKQMITLSTGIIALSVTLLKDVLNDPAARTWTLEWAWLAFGVSVFFGVWFLLALTGSLGSRGIKDEQLSIYGSNATLPMFGQLITFLVGLGLTIAFGMTGLQREPAPPATPSRHGATISKVFSVGPFADADTALSATTWSSVESAIGALLNQEQTKSNVDAILVLGGVDHRALSPAAARKFGSNQGLANARAEVLRTRLAKTVGDSVAVFALALGALELEHRAATTEWTRDRRVDVYFLSRPRAASTGGPNR